MVTLKTFQRKRSLIGLDIGACGVRAVQLLRDGNSYAVENAACSDRQRPANETGFDPRLSSRQIADCLRGASFHGKVLAAALATPDMEFHTLELPAAALNTGEAEGAQIARFEIERLMTQQQVPVETRYWQLPKTSIPAPNAIGAGATHETIHRMVEACSQVGWICSEVDTTATALSRLGAHLQDRSKEEIWGILDAGDRQARLVLCLQDTPLLVRVTGVGGRTWTQRIADALQVSFKAAEIHKRDHGIAATGRKTRSATDDGARSELASLILGALRADLNDLAAEVKRSYEYVLSCYPSGKVGDLVLCGGGSQTHNLSEFLGNALGIPVRRASDYLGGPSCRLRPTFVSNASIEVLAVAAGLAIPELPHSW